MKLMKKQVPIIAALIGMVVAGGLSTIAGEDPERKRQLEMWNDDSFQKQFLGSYGFQAEIEPRVTSDERQEMEKLLPLISSDPDQAIEQLEKMTLPESSAVFDFMLGNLYFQQEQLEQAAEHYRNALVKFPSFRRAHKNLGLIYVRTGEFDKATKSLSRVIQLGGGDGLTFGLLGYSYSSTEQFVSAESAYRSALLVQPDVLDWKLGLTQSVLKQQKYGEAVSLTEGLLARFPERADYWLLQANAYIGLGQPLEAAQNYEIVQRMGKATLGSLNTLGDIYVNEEMWDLAARAYGNAAQLDPKQDLQRPLRNVEVLAQRGALNQAQTLVSRIKELYAQRLDEAEHKKLLKLEARIAVAEGGGGEAVGVLEEIVALDPLDGEALMLLGQHYARVDETERAIFYYERAEGIDGFEAEAKVRHAQLLVGQSKYSEAVPLLKRAQELQPREEVAQYLEQVERVARAGR